MSRPVSADPAVRAGSGPWQSWISRHATLAAASVIVLAAVAAYSNSFRGPFIFDDNSSTTGNATIRQLWPIWQVFCPPANGEVVQRRPVVNLSVAINYAISEFDVWSYHALNLLAHISAALLLFGVVRRTLRLPVAGNRLAKAATPLALIVAVLWVVHPLLTDAVTYIMQRTEVLAGLFYLLTLYCTIRGATSNLPSPAGRGAGGEGSLPTTRSQPIRRQAASNAVPPHPSPLPAGEGTCVFAKREGTGWYAAAVFACALAMGSKESATSAPVVVLLYDRVFLSESWRAVFRRRWGLYLGLAATWSVILIMLPHGNEGASVFQNDIRPIDYALAQSGVIAHYLRLCFWPHPLILDYGYYTPQPIERLLPFLVLIGVLLVGTAVAFRYQSWLGFLGVWFFAILAPSSSVIPLFQNVAGEKRMYLPLAAVVAGVVIGGYLMGRRLVDRAIVSPCVLRLGGVAMATLIGVIFIAMTVRRNMDYRSAWSIWSDTVAKAPSNARAHDNLALTLANEKRFNEAVEHHRRAIALYEEMLDKQEARQIVPCLAEVYRNLGNALNECGRPDEAEASCREALRLRPDFAGAFSNLGNALLRRRQVGEAVECFRKATDLEPDNAVFQFNLANALYEQKMFDDAKIRYREALRLNPDLAEAHRNLAMLLSTCPEASVRNGPEAVAEAKQAVELTGGREPMSLDALAAAYAELGRFPEAIQAAEQAIQVAAKQNVPGLAEAIQAKLSLYRSGMPYREM